MSNSVKPACDHDLPVAGCYGCAFFARAQRLYAAENKLQFLETESESRHQKHLEDIANGIDRQAEGRQRREEYLEIENMKALWMTYRDAMNKLQDLDRPGYISKKEASKTNPNVWTKDIHDYERAQKLAQIQSGASVSKELSFVPQDVARAQPMAALDRTAIPAQLDAILDFPRGTRLATASAQERGLAWNLSKAIGTTDKPATMSVGSTWQSELRIPSTQGDDDVLQRLRELNLDVDGVTESSLLKKAYETYGNDAHFSNEELVRVFEPYHVILDTLLAYYAANTSGIARAPPVSESDETTTNNDWDDSPDDTFMAKQAELKQKREQGEAESKPQQSPFENRTRTAHAFAQWIKDCESHYGGRDKFKTLAENWAIENRERMQKIWRRVDKHQKFREETERQGQESHWSPAGTIPPNSPRTHTQLQQAPVMDEDADELA